MKMERVRMENRGNERKIKFVNQGKMWDKDRKFVLLGIHVS